MKAIKIIERALRTPHDFSCFCMEIQSKKKSQDKRIRDKIRAKINPEVREENGNLCSLCKRNLFEVSKSNTIHHINPERYSGTYDKDNLLVVCKDCHVIIENCIRVVEHQAIRHTLEYLRKIQTDNKQKISQDKT
jgi:hypothetical protein